MEETLNELEQMERVGLFTREEVRKITKKRKALEYRLQRRTKSKEDYLKYIQNEVQILDLVRRRREHTGYMFKKSDIDYSIAKRINRLFRQAIMRFQGDVNIWTSHINFCKRMNWPESISRMYSRLLQVHSNKPELWVAAAHWEMKEHKASETARQIMLRSLRFHPDSKLIYHEFFRLELMYTDLILKRRRALGMSDQVDPDESDAVVECKLAQLIYRKAAEQISDVDFHIGFLPICREFKKFSKCLEEVIYKALLEKHPNEEATWDYVAKRHMLNPSQKAPKTQEDPQPDNSEDDVHSAIRKCLQTYKEAVKKIPTDKMWTMYVNTCMSVFRNCNQPQTSELVLDHLLRALHEASKSSLLTEPLYAEWVKILDSTHRTSEADSVLEVATKQYPLSVQLWENRIKTAIRNGQATKDIQSLFNDAMSSVNVAMSLPLWKLAAEWLMLSNPSKVKALLEKSLTLKHDVAQALKSLYLEFTALNDGIDEARNLYERLSTTPPMSEEFFGVMFKVEKSQMKPSIERLRKILEDFILNFGSTNINPWLDYIQLEMAHPDGNPGCVTRLHWRALKTLEPQLEAKFVTAYTLISTGVIKS